MESNQVKIFNSRSEAETAFYNDLRNKYILIEPVQEPGACCIYASSYFVNLKNNRCIETDAKQQSIFTFFNDNLTKTYLIKSNNDNDDPEHFTIHLNLTRAHEYLAKTKVPSIRDITRPAMSFVKINGTYYYNFVVMDNSTFVADTSVPNQDEIRTFKKFIDTLSVTLGSTNLDYIFHFISQIAQDPLNRLPKAIILSGDEGTGKSLLMDLIKASTFGDLCYECEFNLESSNENIALLDRLVVVFNEIMMRNIDTGDEFKKFISDKRYRYHQKYRSTITANNYARTIVCSNHINPVNIGKHARRWTVLHTQADYTTSKAIWDKSYDSMMSNYDALVKVCRYVMFNFKYDKNYIMTYSGDVDNQKIAQFNKVEMFIYERINSWLDGSDEISSTLVHLRKANKSRLNSYLAIPLTPFVADFNEYNNTHSYKSDILKALNIQPKANLTYYRIFANIEYNREHDELRIYRVEKPDIDNDNHLTLHDYINSLINPNNPNDPNDNDKKTKRVSKEDIEECDNEKDLDSQVNIACKETFETYRSNDVEELDCRSVVVETDQKSIYEDRNQAKEAYDILGLSSDNRSVFESNSSVQSRRSDRIGVLEPVSRAGDDVQLAVSFGSVRSDSLGRSCDEICDADRKCESIQEKIQTFEKDSINENSQTTDQLSRTDIEHINNADIIVRGQAYDLYNRNDNGEYETVNPTSDSRKDADCLSMQNFLIESDETSLEDQHAITKQLARDGIINRSVFSGSKSIHNIITVRDKVESIDEYKFVFRQLTDYIEQNYNVKVDRNCCNPARLTRRPNAKRADKNCVQKLLYISDNIFDFKFKLNFKKYQQDQLQKEALHFLSVEQAEDVFANNPVAKQKALVTNRKNVDLFLDGLEHCVDGQHHTYVVDRIKSVIPQMRSLVRAGLFCWNEVLMILKRHGVKDRFEHYRKIVHGL